MFPYTKDIFVIKKKQVNTFSFYSNNKIDTSV